MVCDLFLFSHIAPLLFSRVIVSVIQFNFILVIAFITFSHFLACVCVIVSASCLKRESSESSHYLGYYDENSKNTIAKAYSSSATNQWEYCTFLSCRASRHVIQSCFHLADASAMETPSWSSKWNSPLVICFLSFFFPGKKSLFVWLWLESSSWCVFNGSLPNWEQCNGLPVTAPLTSLCVLHLYTSHTYSSFQVNAI